MSNLKVLELTIDDINFDGVTAISIVNSPAIEENFLIFSKNDFTFAKADLEKRIITGPALIPNKLIYRYDYINNEEYNVFFSEETVSKISENFLINNKISNITLEHQVNINDVYLIESWIVTNPEMDKSKFLGFDVNKGTWMISLKILNDNIWNDIIKKGLVKGFSIEGYFTTKINKFNNIDDYEKLKIIKKIINDYFNK